MDKKEIPFLTASQLSKLIETKEVSPVEATEAYLDRIQEVDSQLNSYITVIGERALEAARQIPSELDDRFADRHCPSVVEAMHRLCEWVVDSGKRSVHV